MQESQHIVYHQADAYDAEDGGGAPSAILEVEENSGLYGLYGTSVQWANPVSLSGQHLASVRGSPSDTDTHQGAQMPIQRGKIGGFSYAVVPNSGYVGAESAVGKPDPATTGVGSRRSVHSLAGIDRFLSATDECFFSSEFYNVEDTISDLELFRERDSFEHLLRIVRDF